MTLSFIQDNNFNDKMFSEISVLIDMKINIFSHPVGLLKLMLLFSWGGGGGRW